MTRFEFLSDGIEVNIIIDNVKVIKIYDPAVSDYYWGKTNTGKDFLFSKNKDKKYPIGDCPDFPLCNIYIEIDGHFFKIDDKKYMDILKSAIDNHKNIVYHT